MEIILIFALPSEGWEKPAQSLLSNGVLLYHLLAID